MNKKTLFWIGGAIVLLIVVIILIANKGKAKAESKRGSQEGTDSPEDNQTMPLHFGSEGKEVEQLQIFLVKKFGARFPKFGTDGRWGAETAALVNRYLGTDIITKEFYEQNGLGNIKTTFYR